jgi:4-amino-4-deoxy-L-arabinose transferase-like glycosyltransferase
VTPLAPDAVDQYKHRLVVPEPDRAYSHGSGKPLLATVLTIPQLGLIQLLTRNGDSLLEIKHRYNYHPLFILVRAVQILAGLFTLLLVHRMLAAAYDPERAVWGSAVFALFPLTPKFFANIHHDSVLAPFLVLTVHWYLKRRWWKCGVAFGLALASKNAAVFLVPALLVHSAYQAFRAASPGDRTAWRPTLAREARGLLVVAAVSLVVLVPFANPVSYAEEILTPISGRAFDPRGEDVRAFTTSGRLAEQSVGGLSVLRPEIRLLHHLLYFDQVAFFFFALVLFGLLPRCTTDLARVSLGIVLLSVPFGLVFGHALDYRSLFFLPFFAIACADLLGRRALRGLVFLLALLCAVYALDPITTSRATYPVEDRTLLQSLRDRVL